MALRIDDLAGADAYVTTLAGDWNGTPRRIPLPGGGLAVGTVRDGGNCFNLNSLVQGEATAVLVQRPAGDRAIRRSDDRARPPRTHRPADRRFDGRLDRFRRPDQPAGRRGRRLCRSAARLPHRQYADRRSERASRRRRSHAGNLPGAAALSLRASGGRHVADQRQHPACPRCAPARHVRSGQGPAGPGTGADRVPSAGGLAHHVRFLAQRGAGRG